MVRVVAWLLLQLHPGSHCWVAARALSSPHPDHRYSK